MKLFTLCLGCLVIFSLACKRDREIKVYRVAKENSAEAQPATPADPHAGLPGMTPGAAKADPHAGLPGMTPGAAKADPHAGLSPEQMAAAASNENPQFADTPPAHWKKQTRSAMRQASYLVQGEGGATADISFSILRRASGGTLANINRWRDQLGLPPVDEAALQQASQKIPSAFGDAILVDLEGLLPGADAAKDGRLIGAIADVEQEAWFFKMRGNAALTAAEKQHFIQWIQTVKPATPATPATPAPSES